jgi:hypothetical protein
MKRNSTGGAGYRRAEYSSSYDPQAATVYMLWNTRAMPYTRQLVVSNATCGWHVDRGMSQLQT